MKKFFAVAALLATTVLVPAPAHAAPAPDTDTKPCISGSEFNAALRGTMHQEEIAWEVVGLGHIVSAAHHGQHIVKQYPYCGRPQSIAFVQVAYDRNLAGEYMTYSFSRWVWRPTGHVHH